MCCKSLKCNLSLVGATLISELHYFIVVVVVVDAVVVVVVVLTSSE